MSKGLSERPSFINLVSQQSSLDARHLSRYKWLRNEQDRPDLYSRMIYNLWRNTEAQTRSQLFLYSTHFIFICSTLYDPAHYRFTTLLSASTNWDVNPQGQGFVYFVLSCNSIATTVVGWLRVWHQCWSRKVKCHIFPIHLWRMRVLSAWCGKTNGNHRGQECLRVNR